MPATTSTARHGGGPSSEASGQTATVSVGVLSEALIAFIVKGAISGWIARHDWGVEHGQQLVQPPRRTAAPGLDTVTKAAGVMRQRAEP